MGELQRVWASPAIIQARQKFGAYGVVCARARPSAEAGQLGDVSTPTRKSSGHVARRPSKPMPIEGPEYPRMRIVGYSQAHPDVFKGLIPHGEMSIAVHWNCYYVVD